MRYACHATVLALLLAASAVKGEPVLSHPFSRRMPMPPMPDGLTWLNTAAPVELSDLKGKFVLLDFWTYCCINCMHVLPELEKLENAYPGQLVVLGVHSAKFDTEKEVENIREAVVRHRIRHPVVVDSDHVIWNRLGVRAWPTILLIDPEGKVVWGKSGEFTFDVIDELLQKSLPYYRDAGLLDESPVRFDLESDKIPSSPLRFPGKVLADASSNRLFIADSGHNRLVVADFEGKLLATIGSGRIGRVDGDFEEARFNDPQGMALDGDILYLADTLNHSIRRIDLERREVTTVAGTGHASRDEPSLRMSDPTDRALSSPWALWIHQSDLYVAMAGTHQIWRMRLDGSAIGPWAGSGLEDIVDGGRLPPRAYSRGHAAFAQPSGLTSDGTWLYVADSEGSSIRAVSFNPNTEVRTVVGTAHVPHSRLFTFGDIDGPAETARMQHPLGVVFHRETLYVADTYNNKIRGIDPATGRTWTVAGDGRAGSADHPARFDEPAGITAAAGLLFVADTNNHAIRSVDPVDGGRTRTLTIAGLEAPERPVSQRPSFSDAVKIRVQPTQVRPEDDHLRIHVTLELPPGQEVNLKAPMTYWIDADADTGPVRRAALSQPVQLETPKRSFEIRLPLDTPTGHDTLQLGLTYYYCRHDGTGLCRQASVLWTLPLELTPTGKPTITLKQ